MKKSTRTEQETHLASWRDSGLTAVEYCKKKDIKVQTFYGWIKSEKNRKQKLNTSAERMGLIKVQPSAEQQLTSSTTVLLEFGKLKIHIPESSLARTLAAITPVLEASNVH